MSFFDKSKNFSITESQFTSITIKTDTRKKGFDLLYEHTAPGAFHDSAERYDPPKCHSNTPVAIIQAIVDWVEDGQKTTFIKWMYGAAGAGKSAIAQEIADRYHKSGRLAASFFWSRHAAGRNDEKRLIPSLAYQLLIAIPQIRDHVEEAVENDPSIFARSIEAQMESLIIRPLEKIFGHGQEVLVTNKIPKLIILDGLDECGTPQAQQYILKVIAHSVRKFSTPIFFLIASRPEQAIRASFHVDPLLSIAAKLVLNEKYCPDNDIELFLVESFESVKSTHELRSLLPHVWPTKPDIDRLVLRSSGQFIYAATVVKFVSASRRMPSTQLEIILGIAVIGDTPFAELDALYHHIFSSMEDSQCALEILSIFFLTRNRVFREVDVIKTILSYSPGKLELTLIDLHSVMEVPDAGDEHRMLDVLHASLWDFLMDPTRSGNFFIDQGKAHAHIAQCFLQYINNYFPNAPDTGFDQGSELVVFEELKYHCSLSSPTRELLDIFFHFDLLKWASSMLLRGFDIPDYLGLYMLYYLNITGLYRWLQAQEANVQAYFGPECSLSMHHSHSWEAAINLLCKTFYNQISTNKDIDIITTAITHPQILYYHYKFRVYNLKTRVEPFTQVLECQILDDCLSCVEDEDDWLWKEPVELQNYLRDPECAGTCFVHGGKYATLSAKLFEFILEKFGQLEEEWQVEGDEGTPESNFDIMDKFDDCKALLFAIQILPFYLSNADYKPDLVRHASNILKSKFWTWEGELPKGMNNLRQAINLYLKWKRSPMPQAGRELKRKCHKDSEETLKATNLAMFNLASPLTPPPKRLRFIGLVAPDTELRQTPVSVVETYHEYCCFFRSSFCIHQEALVAQARNL